MRHKTSSGLLMYRHARRELEVFIAHPGGPYFAHSDVDCWSIPKGEVEPGESLLETAMREFKEEVGLEPKPPYLELGSVRQRSGKIVYAWGFEGDWDESQPIQSSPFELEWPTGSGKMAQFPEVDRADFFTLDRARRRLKMAQHPFLDRLVDQLALLQRNK
jgi:predicted NUDIX family NTP pyrophosphohydrolase